MNRRTTGEENREDADSAASGAEPPVKGGPLPSLRNLAVGTVLAVVVAAMAWVGRGPDPGRTLNVGVRGENLVRLDLGLDRHLVRAAVTGEVDVDGISSLINGLENNLLAMVGPEEGVAHIDELVPRVQALRDRVEQKLALTRALVRDGVSGERVRDALNLSIANQATHLVSRHSEYISASAEASRSRLLLLSALAFALLTWLLLRLRADAWALASANRRLIAAVKRGDTVRERQQAGDHIFQNLVQSANSAILRVDRDGKVTFFNRFAESFFGFRTDEIIGRPLVGSILPLHDQDGRNLDTLLRDVIRNPDEYARMEVENRRRDGSRAWFLWTLKGVREPDGRRREILAIGSDISDRRRTEGLLLDQRTVLAQIARGESHGRVLESVARLVGDRLEGAACSVHCHGDVGVVAQKLSASTLEALSHWQPPLRPDGGKDVYTYVLAQDPGFADVAPALADEGFNHAWLIAFGPVRAAPQGVLVAWLPDDRPAEYGDEEVLHAAAALCSIASVRVRMDGNLLAAKEEAETTAREKSNFLARMSHEIRTPISGLLGILDLLKDLEGMQQDVRAQLELAHKSAVGLLTILDDILDLSKIEAGKLSIESVSFDLRRLVEDVTDMFAHRALAKGIHMASRVDYALPRQVLGDPTRIRQVLSNLISNAVKFTSKGEIMISVEPSGEGGVYFSVRDTGIGISDAARDRIFESYVQAEADTTREFGGTGLGLSLSRELVERMDGKIGVNSKEGQGSVFYVVLPLEETRSAAEPSDVRDGLRGRKLLLLDDEPSRELILRDHFAHWGARLDVEHDASAVASRVASDSYDHLLVSSDLLEDQKVDMSLVLEDASSLHCILMTPVHHRFRVARLNQSCNADTVVNLPLRQDELYRALNPEKDTDGGAQTLVSEPVPPSGPPVDGGRDWRHARLLLVEDQEVNQVVALGLLKRLGIEASLATNGQEALDLLAREHFDVVLMDCEMPVLDGYQATEQLREREGDSGAHVPVVALTAHALPEHRERCMAVGMDDYLTKPYKISDLERVLQHWIGGDENADAPGASESQGAESGRDDQPRLEADASGAIDEAAFADIAETFGEDIGMLVDSFTGLLDDKLSGIRAAFEQGDADALRQRAHAFKGVAHSVAAVPAAQLAKTLEDRAGSGELDGLDSVVSELEERARAAGRALERAVA
ncbi:MAG: ATP-binding protein [Gammaproteobacteria bacterium]